MGPGGGPRRGPHVSEKSKNFGQAIRRLLKEMMRYKVLIFIALSLATAGSVISILTPNLLSDLADEITNGLVTPLDFSVIYQIGWTLAFLYIISAVCQYIDGFLMTTVTNSFARELRDRISKKINKLPLKYFDNHQTGDILSRITNDVDTIAQSADNSFATLVWAAILFLGVTLMMFITNGIMAFTAIVASTIGFALVIIITSKSQKYFDARQRELGKINSHIEEIFSGLNVVRAYNGAREVSAKFDRLNQAVYDANRKSQFLGGMMPPLMGFVGNLGYVAVCVVGALLAANGAISFGVIVAFISYVNLFTSPLRQIAQAVQSLQSAAAAGERVFEFLDETEMPVEIKGDVLRKSETRGEVIFSNVKFSYVADKPIIKNFSAVAQPGQKIAIVGPTGAGKTTMVNLLMKFYDIDSGDIKIDGVSIKTITRENVHNLFTMVLQDTWLFAGTVRENIVYNHKNITDKHVREVCEQVGLTHFVNTLPNGLDTELFENDAVSAGQRQLLTIARGMIKDAPFLILDEATSNVDTRTEELVQKAMDKLTEGRTSFIIAHRLSTIKNADLILVMKDGDIVETGTHQELLNANGFYAKLYNAQFSK